MKVVINRQFGGFSLSEKAYEFLRIKWDRYGHNYRDYSRRADPKLVECVETLGSEEASGKFATLEVVEIPDDVDWTISYYDGMEEVVEVHRSWC